MRTCLDRRHSDLAAMAALALLGTLAWRPLLEPGLLLGHDTLFHLSRLIELNLALQHGEIYPRLAPNLALGYDYPVFNYYGPLGVYLSALWHLAGMGIVDALKATAGLTIVLAGWSMYICARDLLPRPGALAAGLAYLYLPYLLVDVYTRGALAEALALALLPIGLWAFRRMAIDGVRYLPPAALAVTGIVLAHNITALFFIPVALAYWLLGLLAPLSSVHQQRSLHFLVSPLDTTPLGESSTDQSSADSRLTRPQKRWVRKAMARTLVLLAALVLGMAVASFYWLPALGERDFVATERLTSRFFDYRNHFHPWRGLVQDTIVYDYGYDYHAGRLFKAGLVQTVLALSGLAAGWRWHRLARLSLSFWGSLFAISLIMQVRQAASVWDQVPLLAYVQFPWRMLSLTGLASSMLTGYLIAATFPGRSARSPTMRWLGYGICATLMLAVVLAATANLSPRPTQVRESDLSPWLLQRMELDRQLIAGTLGEYLPRWSEVEAYEHQQSQSLNHAPSANATTARLTVDGAGPFSFAARLTDNKAGDLTLDRFFFPGWQAIADGEQIPVRPSGPLGLLTVDLPSGAERIEVRFEDTSLRSSAWLTSASAAAILVALALLLSRTAASLGTLVSIVVALLVLLTATGRGGTTQPTPIGAQFGSAIWLASVLEPNYGTGSGESLEVTLFWQALERPERDYWIALRLLDDNGRVVGVRTKQPQFGLRPTRLWEKGMLVRDQQEIRLAEGQAGGSYHLAIGIFDRSISKYVQPSGGALVTWVDPEPQALTPTEGIGVIVGEYELASPPEYSTVGPVSSSGVRFAGVIELLGYDLAVSSSDGWQVAPPNTVGPDGLVTVAGGQRLAMRLHWLALTDIDEDYAVFTHLLDHRQDLRAQDDEWPRRGFRPTTLWHPGEIVEDDYLIEIPPDLPAGRYELSVGLYHRTNQERLPIDESATRLDRLSLASVRVVPAEPLTRSSVPQGNLLDARLGESISLIGYQLDGEMHPGSSLGLTLFWQAEAPLSENFTVFVHLSDMQERMWAQSDQQPGNGGFPTTLWQPNEIVADQRQIPLPTDLADGDYRLWVGMYRLETGERLVLSTGGDRLLLESISYEKGYR